MQGAAFVVAGQGFDCSIRRYPDRCANSPLPISACQSGNADHSFAISFRTPSRGSHFDRLPQPSCVSYSPNLPLLRLAGATPLKRPSEVPELDRTYFVCLAVGSACRRGLSA